MNTTQTPSELAAAETTILTAPIMGDAQADALLNTGLYTTTALAALANAQERVGDEVGAELIRAFARQFAKHEATTI